MQLGPIEHRQCRSKDEPLRILRLRGAYLCLRSWRTIGSADTQSAAGFGFPVLATDDSPVNFLKIRHTGTTFEESLIHGHPISQCHVHFGEETKDILIAVDWISAMALHLATDLRVVVALYGDNLIWECRRLKKRYPESRFKVCFNGIGNNEECAKLAHASEAASAIGALVVTSGPTTFADIYRKEGAEGVVQRLEERCKTVPWGRDRWDKRLKIPIPAMPWPNRFDGICLLANLIAAIRRHVSMPEDMGLMVSLWIIHTHAISSARFSPLLAIASTEYGTGKATLMTVLHRLCKSAYRTSKVSPGDLLRMINRHQITLLLDDADSMLQSQAFIDILNASHDRLSGGITATVKGNLEAMGAFVAKATKSHGRLPDSLARRSIQISLQRKRPDEAILPLDAYNPEVNDEMTALQSQLARWTEDHLPNLRGAGTPPIDLGNDRLNDTFGPLMVIAAAIGGDALSRAELVARKLLSHDDAKSEGVQLLEHIREILQAKRIVKIHSVDLVEGLCARTEWSWATCNKGKPLDQLLLAKILRGYDIKPDNIRVGDASRRGYWADDFRDAFVRYLPEAD